MVHDRRSRGWHFMAASLWAATFLMCSCTNPSAKLAPTGPMPAEASPEVVVGSTFRMMELANADRDYEFPLDQLPFESEVVVRARATARIVRLWEAGYASVRCLINVIFPTELANHPKYTPGKMVIGSLSHDPVHFLYLTSPREWDGTESDCSAAIKSLPAWTGGVAADAFLVSTVTCRGVTSETWAIDLPTIATRECQLGAVFDVTLEPMYFLQSSLRPVLCRDELLVTFAPWGVNDGP